MALPQYPNRNPEPYTGPPPGATVDDALAALIRQPTDPADGWITPEDLDLALRIVAGQGSAGDIDLDDLSDVDVHLSATGMVLTKQQDGSWKGQNVRQSLNQIGDVTAPPDTPPNSLLGTVGDGLTAGVAEWEPLHLDYVQQVVLGPLPSAVADLGARVTDLEHTDAVVPPDLTLGVDNYSNGFTRIIGCDPITASPTKRLIVTLATTPGPGGAVFASLADVSGTGAVWADFGGTLGKVVDSGGTGINGAALKEAIRRGQIITAHRGDDGNGHPTLVVVKVEDPADAGSSLTLGALHDVEAPANTPAGKVLGTTAEGAWGPVDPPSGGLTQAQADARYQRTFARDGLVWYFGIESARPAWPGPLQGAGVFVSPGDVAATTEVFFTTTTGGSGSLRYFLRTLTQGTQFDLIRPYLATQWYGTRFEATGPWASNNVEDGWLAVPVRVVKTLGSGHSNGSGEHVLRVVPADLTALEARVAALETGA